MFLQTDPTIEILVQCDCKTDLDIDKLVPFMDPMTDMAISTGTINAIDGTVSSQKVCKKKALVDII